MKKNKNKIRTILLDGDDRVRAIINEIIPKLVKQGWRLDTAGGGAVEKIWRGERQGDKGGAHKRMHTHNCTRRNLGLN